MPITRTYFRDDNFVLTQIYAKLTAAQLAEHVDEMNREYCDAKGIIELADCRYLTDVSELDAKSLIFSAGMERGQPRAEGGKGAIVVANDEIYGLAMMYAAVARNARVDSRVYRSMEEAIEWLGLEHLHNQIENLSNQISTEV